MDLLQINKFANLHDGRQILFCRTEHVRQEFKKIKKLKNEVILISGNSDLGILPGDTAAMPDNIAMWYGQNVLTKHDKLKVIPLGLENTQACRRKEHGTAWPHAAEKLDLLARIGNDLAMVVPSKLLYSNFNQSTNIAHRAPIKEISKKLAHITWEEPSLGYRGFINSVLDHQAVLCPAGNGLDTHRIYEVLYCGRIAVTFRTAVSPLYDELYSRLPVVILDHLEELEDTEKLKERIIAVKERPVSEELLDFGYWQQRIMSGIPEPLVKKKPYFSTILKFISGKPGC
ncbi:hypothetical protein KXD93_21235 [Mucilaginibacter sp. BJC16-A38]|uniref:hypothetical protein n=1 Tax=Mucilaginibacter phenanthrenivorans TaxID=1234842 RepID=UPI002156FA8B|nr:hypothetical protein [Mucilaginibacter phenanthrenivorans]MCR8560190.1 hypothetical protein [Mucilaginibacter phenanthrenivorans]